MDDEAVKPLKAALENGAIFWNAVSVFLIDGDLTPVLTLTLSQATFYGPPDRHSLHILKRYFSEHPQDAARVVLSVTGAYTSATLPIPGATGWIGWCRTAGLARSYSARMRCGSCRGRLMPMRLRASAIRRCYRVALIGNYLSWFSVALVISSSVRTTLSMFSLDAQHGQNFKTSLRNASCPANSSSRFTFSKKFICPLPFTISNLFCSDCRLSKMLRCNSGGTISSSSGVSIITGVGLTDANRCRGFHLAWR